MDREQIKKQIFVTLPKHAVEYLENVAKQTGETISEIIKVMVFDHCIEHLEIVYQDGQRRIDGKTFENYYNEYKYLKEHLSYWPEGSKEHVMIRSRLHIVKDRLDLLGD